MKQIVLAVLLIVPPLVGSADPLDDAAKACVMSLVDPGRESNPHRPPMYKQGWEHCGIIAEAWQKREADKLAADEAKNPVLKSSREIAKKLQEGK